MINRLVTSRLLILAVLVVLGSLAIFVTQGKLKKDPIPDNIQVETKVVQETGEGWQVDLQIPVITGDAKEELLQKWNNSFENQIREFAEVIRGEGSSFAQDAKKEGWRIISYEAVATYDVTFNQDGLLSLNLTYYQYTGGAHGMTFRDNYTLNLLSGEKLTLEQIVQRDDYQEVINQFIQEQIDQTPGDYFPDAFEGITPEQGFYLTEDALVIYFDLYEIAPYAAGMPTFEIPWDKLGVDLQGLVQ